MTNDRMETDLVAKPVFRPEAYGRVLKHMCRTGLVI